MECKHAYQALSDTKQRSRYDREQVLSYNSRFLPIPCTCRLAHRTVLWQAWACLSCIRPAHSWRHGPGNWWRHGKAHSGGCAQRSAGSKQAAEWPSVALQSSIIALLSTEGDSDPASRMQRGGLIWLVW